MKKIIFSLYILLALVSFQSKADMYVIGLNGDWTLSNQEQMTESSTSTGVYSITKTITSDIWFVFTDINTTSWDDINNGHRWGSGQGSDYNVAIGTAAKCDVDATGNGSYHFQGDGSTYTVTVDTNAKTVLVESDGSGQSTDPTSVDALWVIGELGEGWYTNVGKAFATTDGGKTWNLNVDVDATGNKYFSLTSKLAEGSGDWDGIVNYRWGGNYTTTVGTPQVLDYKTGNSPSVNIETTGSYNLNFVVATKTLTVTKDETSTVKPTKVVVAYDGAGNMSMQFSATPSTLTPLAVTRFNRLAGDSVYSLIDHQAMKSIDVTVANGMLVISDGFLCDELKGVTTVVEAKTKLADLSVKYAYTITGESNVQGVAGLNGVENDDNTAVSTGVITIDFSNIDDISTAVADVNAAKTVAGVKYYNLNGQESSSAFEGMNMVVTTYTDGSRAVAKVMK